MNTTPTPVARDGKTTSQKQRDEIREERDAALETIAALTSLLCEVESALIDAPATAEIRLARMKVRKAIAKATGEQS